MTPLQSIFEQAIATVSTAGDTLKTLDYHHPQPPSCEEPYQHWTGVSSPMQPLIPFANMLYLLISIDMIYQIRDW